MAQRDSGIHFAPREHQADGTADRDATPQHAHLLAMQAHAVMVEQLNHTTGRARQWRGQGSARMQHEFAEIERVHAIGVLGRVDRIDDGIGVNALR